MISKTNFRLRRGLLLPNLGLAVVEGIIFFVYLLVLAKDPKNNLFLGFSSQRLFLLAGVFAATGLFSLLYFYFQRHAIQAARIDTWLLAQKYRIPACLTGYFLLCLVVFVWLVLREPGFFLISILENHSLLIRLAPFWGWALLLPLQLGFFWLYEWKWARLSRPSYLFLAALLVFLLLGLRFYQDYGLSWDEPQQVVIARANDNYITRRSDQLLTLPDRYYGPVYEIILLRLTDNTDTRQMFLNRHLANFLFFFAGVVAFFWLARRLFGSAWLALVASLCLMLSPRIFADAFYNTKDIPFMVAFIFAMLSMLIFLDRPSWETAVLHGGFSAFLIAIRVPGIFILLTTLGFLAARWIFQRGPEKVLGVELLAGCIYLVFTLGLMTFFWPILWQNPLVEFINGLKLMSQYDTWTGQLFYLGQILEPKQIPWHYIPVWISISTPLLYLASFGVGVTIMLADLFRQPGGWFTGKKRTTLIILMSFFGPLLAVIWLHSILYNAWRQMFFIYPAFLLAGVQGMRYAVGLLERRLPPFILVPVVIISLAVGLLEPLIFMVRNHPYQNVFFNPLAGENMLQIKQRFEVDYWGLSYRAGIETILKTDPGEKIPIYVTTDPGKNFILNFLPADLRDRFILMNSPTQARYFVGDYYNHPQEYPYQQKIFSVEVGGASLLSVFDLRKEPGNQSQ